MKPINPSAVRHIKLGEGGCWERDCVTTGTLRLGFVGAPHDLCLLGKWKGVHAYWRRRKFSKGVASNYVTDLRRFYTDDASVLWITWHDHLLWWCFSDPATLELLADGTKTRLAEGGWKSVDANGTPLSIGRLSRVIHYRNNPRTICNVKEARSVVDRINGRGSEGRVIPEEVEPAGRYVEGSVRVVRVNAYERSRKARAACVRHHGPRCAACRTDMAVLYGELGRGVIHVHHLKEVSSLKEAYEVDPARDLRPVCPNCHAILHTRSPCMSVEELREHLSTRHPVLWPAG